MNYHADSQRDQVYDSKLQFVHTVKKHIAIVGVASHSRPGAHVNNQLSIEVKNIMKTELRHY